MSSSIDASGTLYIQQSGSDIQYSSDNSSWSNIVFPVTINNTTPNITTILTVLFTTDITTTITGFRFIAGSEYITFAGSNKTITINGNLTNTIFKSIKDGTIVKDFIIRGTGTMTSLCGEFAQYSQASLLNCINY